MMQTLVGRKGFENGMTLYFQRHDGQAVTCDDFAQAIADANPDSPLAALLPQFKRWYAQAGTPRVHAAGHYDASHRSYTLTLSQSCAPTPGQPLKEPFVIPVALGLVADDGTALPLHYTVDSAEAPSQAALFTMTGPGHTLVFHDLDAAPVPSLLRGFSAPVILDIEYSDTQLLTLLAHDTDPFNRWEAAQRLALRHALKAIAAEGDVGADVFDGAFIEALRAILRDGKLDSAFKELVLTLPSEGYIAEQLAVVDPQRIHAVREAMRLQLATALQADWARAWEENEGNGAYTPDPLSSGRRALAGQALVHLNLAATRTGDTVWPGRTYQCFKDADNMTDRANALVALIGAGHELARPALALFHTLFADEALVIDKWFQMQAGAPDRGGDILPLVKQLMQHPDFSITNPNRARSLVFAYCSGNPAGFHRADGAGYAFWVEQVLALDAINPQVAARLARALDRWKKLADPYREPARAAIARVAASAALSNDTREVISRALAD